MLEVELLAAEALVELGVVPARDAAALRERRPVVDAAFVDAVNQREEITNHDTAAFVDIVQDRIGMPEGAWVHFGLTSSDVVDTAFCATLAAAMDTAIAAGKLSGAVGTFSNIDPSVETYVCSHLGLTPVPATQVIARDRHAQVLYACAALGTSMEQFSLEVRHLARSEVGEVEEPFAPGQKGSSAMPHKRNPVVAERLSGLARVLRGYLQAGLEDVALWHERDISHSSVERVIMPDALQLTVYMLRKATWLADGLVLRPERALTNLTEGSLGLVFSQSVLLALIESGKTRDDAYRIVQAAARTAIEERRNFRDVVEADDDVTLSNEVVSRAFDLDRLLV